MVGFYYLRSLKLLVIPPVVQQPLEGQCLPLIEDSRSHPDTPHFVGRLWTREQPDAETST